MNPAGGDGANPDYPGRRASWDDESRACLLLLLRTFPATKKRNEQLCRNKDVWQHIVAQMNAKFEQYKKVWTIGQIKDQHKQLRSQWDDIKGILRHPEFKWDNEHNMLEASNKDWARLSKEQQAYKIKKLPYYNLLCDAFEGSREYNDEKCHAFGNSHEARLNGDTSNFEQVQPISQDFGVQDVQRAEIEPVLSSPHSSFFKFEDDLAHGFKFDFIMSNNASIQLPMAHLGNHEPFTENQTSTQEHSNQHNNFTLSHPGTPPNVTCQMNNTLIEMKNSQQQNLQHHPETPELSNSRSDCHKSSNSHLVKLGALKRKRTDEVARETNLIGECVELMQQLNFSIDDIDDAIEIFNVVHYQMAFLALTEQNKNLWLRKRIDQRRKDIKDECIIEEQQKNFQEQQKVIEELQKKIQQTYYKLKSDLVDSLKSDLLDSLKSCLLHIRTFRF